MKVFNKAHACWEVVLIQMKWTIQARIYAPERTDVSAKEWRNNISVHTLVIASQRDKNGL